MDEIGEAPCSAIPKVSNLARQANRKRQKARPAEPTDLDFELDERNIPTNFLKADVRVGSRRHLVFSRGEMLDLLAKFKTMVWNIKKKHSVY